MSKKWIYRRQKRYWKWAGFSYDKPYVYRAIRQVIQRCGKDILRKNWILGPYIDVEKRGYI